MVRSCCQCEGPGCVWLSMLGAIAVIVMLLLTWGADALRWCEARGMWRTRAALLLGMALVAAAAAGAAVAVGLELLR